jgi:hypothetical protein
VAIRYAYETEVMDDERGLYAHIVSVPAHSMQYSFERSPQQFVDFFEEMFPEPSFSYVSTNNLLPALMGVLYLAEDGPEFNLEVFVGDASWRWVARLGLADRYAEFASYLAFYPIIPVELSPPKGQSLGSLLAHPWIWGMAITAHAFADQSVPLVVVGGYGVLILMRFANAYLSGAERPMSDLGEHHMAILLERLIPGFKYGGRSPDPNQDDEDE